MPKRKAVVKVEKRSFNQGGHTAKNIKKTSCDL
jgi:hypothetical protein